MVITVVWRIAMLITKMLGNGGEKTVNQLSLLQLIGSTFLNHQSLKRAR